MFITKFYSRRGSKKTALFVMAVCAAALYFCLSVTSDDGFKLEFIPKQQNFSCDDLFINSEAHSFNFSEQYYQDLPLFSDEIKKVNNFSTDGHSAMFPSQYKIIHYLAGRSFVNSICETGFNYGNSSFAFLTAKKDNKVLSFDIGYHAYTSALMNYLEKTYPKRFRYVIGDSTKTIPTFASENPSYKCNMFFVDGSHTPRTAYSDLKSFKQLSEAKNVIVVGDFPNRKDFYDSQIVKAWQRAKDENMIKEIMRCSRKADDIRGFTIGKFI